MLNLFIGQIFVLEPVKLLLLDFYVIKVHCFLAYVSHLTCSLQ